MQRLRPVWRSAATGRWSAAWRPQRGFPRVPSPCATPMGRFNYRRRQRMRSGPWRPRRWRHAALKKIQRLQASAWCVAPVASPLVSLSLIRSNYPMCFHSCRRGAVRPKEGTASRRCVRWTRKARAAWVIWASTVPPLPLISWHACVTSRVRPVKGDGCKWFPLHQRRRRQTHDPPPHPQLPRPLPRLPVLARLPVW